MRVRERVRAPQPQPIIPVNAPGSSSGSSASFDPYHALTTQLREYSQQMSTEMAAHFQRLEQRVDNDFNHICDSIRYMQTCLHDIYHRHTWTAPLLRGRSQPLPSADPPFDAWVPPPVVPEPPASPEDPDFQAYWPLLLMTKRGRVI